MKIHIEEGGKKVLGLRLPAGICLRILLLCMRMKTAKNRTDDSKNGAEPKRNGASAHAVIKALRGAKRQWGSLELVSVSSADGDRVVITL